MCTVLVLFLFFGIILIWRRFYPQKRALAHYAMLNLFFIFLIIGVMFTLPSGICFLEFPSGWTVIGVGILVGLPIGLIMEFVRMNFFVAKSVQSGVIATQSFKKGLLVYLVPVMVLLVPFLHDIGCTRTQLCQMLRFQGEGECTIFALAVILGFGLGSLLFNLGWIAVWEARNHRKLFIACRQ